MGRELLAVIEQIGREKGFNPGRILDAVESALLTAAKKKYGAAENIQVRIDRKSGEVEAISLKKIVNEVTNPKSEVSGTRSDPSSRSRTSGGLRRRRRSR